MDAASPTTSNPGSPADSSRATPARSSGRPRRPATRSRDPRHACPGRRSSAARLAVSARSASAASRCSLIDISRRPRLSWTSPSSRSRSLAVASARARSSAASCIRAVASAIAACRANSSSSSASSGPNTRRSSRLNTTQAPMTRPAPLQRHADDPAQRGAVVGGDVTAPHLVVPVEPDRPAPGHHGPGHPLAEREDLTRLARDADVGLLAVGAGRLVDAADRPAVQPSSSVQRSRMRWSSGRSENSPARSSAIAISPAARAAARPGRRLRRTRPTDSREPRRCSRSGGRTRLALPCDSAVAAGRARGGLVRASPRPRADVKAAPPGTGRPAEGGHRDERGGDHGPFPMSGFELMQAPGLPAPLTARGRQLREKSRRCQQGLDHRGLAGPEFPRAANVHRCRGQAARGPDRLGRVHAGRQRSLHRGRGPGASARNRRPARVGQCGSALGRLSQESVYMPKNGASALD